MKLGSNWQSRIKYGSESWPGRKCAIGFLEMEAHERLGHPVAMLEEGEVRGTTAGRGRRSGNSCSSNSTRAVIMRRTGRRPRSLMGAARLSAGLAFAAIVALLGGTPSVFAG